jgi:hypothetical protein
MDKTAIRQPLYEECHILIPKTQLINYSVNPIKRISWRVFCPLSLYDSRCAHAQATRCTRLPDTLFIRIFQEARVTQAKPIPTQRPGYHAYLLRLWRENGDDWSWRLSLQDTQSGERTGFACLEDLLRFLSEKMQAISPIDSDREKDR